ASMPLRWTVDVSLPKPRLVGFHLCELSLLTTHRPVFVVARLLEDRIHHSLWIGRRNRITRFKDNQFTTFLIAPEDSGKAMQQFCAAADGGLWIGSEMGLLRFKEGR